MKTSDYSGGFLLLLLILLIVNAFKGYLGRSDTTRPSDQGGVLVEVAGEVRWPGVYGFSKRPGLQDVVAKAGGIESETPLMLSHQGDVLLDSGSRVEVGEGGERISAGQMSSFYKVTLGIPVSLNSETAEGLTALPGVGRKLAGAIVRERLNRGGFHGLDELLSVEGLGPSMLERIRPYVTM